LPYSIKSIQIDEEKFEAHSVVPVHDDGNKLLDKLSKINVFVGENNSGKSRFMRGLASSEYLTLLPNSDTKHVESIKRQITSKLEKLYNLHSLDSLGTQDDVLTQIKNHNLQKPLGETKDFLKEVEDVWKDVLRGKGRGLPFNSSASYFGGDANDPRHRHIGQALEGLYSAIQEEYQSVREVFPESGFQFDKLYIPALRGLRPFEGGQDTYLERTKRDYFQQGFSPDIFTGLDLYNHVKNLLLGDLDEREVVGKFQAFLSNAFFGGKDVALIPRRDKDVLYVKIGNENEFPIYDLGDGIQSIIVMTFPLFERSNDKMLVFIEEPEMYLHPGFQRVLINTFMKFDNHQFFMTTHSNHFLDLTLDYDHISIYAFRKQLGDVEERIVHPKFEVENVSNENTQPLELLGVKNSSVFLTNCTIWVEGITDRRYLAHYLEMYMKHLKKEDGNPIIYKEDLHYSFVEYSGGNITHWSFLGGEHSIQVERLCAKLFLISDRDGMKKEERRETLQATLGDRYHCLESREIENLLAPHVLKKVVEDYEGTSIDSLAYTHDQYKNMYLGRFVENKVLKGNKQRRGSYMEESGTVTQKVKFCERALSHIDSFDDLTDEAKSLTEEVYEFIRAQNSN